LEQYVKCTDVVLEFGSGQSTVFFAQKCREVFSIEHDEQWYNRINKELSERGLKNVHYFLYSDQRYWQSVIEYDDQFFDAILIDGNYREEAAIAVLPKLKPGGIMVIDDVQRYIPGKSLSPNAKRNFDLTNETDRKWKKVWDIVKEWHYYWATDNVSDTLILFKPAR